jgi:hypothetical protein
MQTNVIILLQCGLMSRGLIIPWTLLPFSPLPNKIRFKFLLVFWDFGFSVAVTLKHWQNSLGHAESISISVAAVSLLPLECHLTYSRKLQVYSVHGVVPGPAY